MQRTTVGVLTAAALAVTLMTGCAAEDDTEAYPCGAQPVIYVERDGDDGDEEFHCGAATGTVVPVYMLDLDVKTKAKSTPGKAVPYTPPKTTFVKPAAPKAPAGAGAKPAAPAPKVPAPKSGK